MSEGVAGLGRADSRRLRRQGSTAAQDATLIRNHNARPRRTRRIAATLVVGLVLAGLIVGWIQYPTFRDDSSFIQHQAANAAIEALTSGDLDSVEDRLAANRGKPDFAYFFASQASPRVLGDALGSVAGEKEGELKNGVDAHQYELTLTDLAGALALATYGTGDRALPASWADKFATATTTPDSSKKSDVERAAQDQADKQNLLLLLARGSWSTEFLQTVTKAYWTFDHHEGSNAWPGTKSNGAKYAPAPNGTYLTDGILALTAALTTNSSASAWAFTDYQPGVENVTYADGSKHSIGKFSHYLFIDHRYPKGADGDSVGITAGLTALSAAIGVTDPARESISDTQAGSPHSDSLVLQAMAKSATTVDDGSAFVKAWHGVEHVVESAWHWIVGVVHRWGHTVLNILSLATMTPPPFDIVGIPVGVTAAAVNATWYAIDGDYAEAGLALATAVPGLAFGKFVKAGREGVTAAKAAVDAGEAGVKVVNSSVESTQLTKVASAWRWITTPAAKVGKSTTKLYRNTFFAAHPELDPAQTVVHHAVEQNVLVLYPGKFSESEIHSLENLRGIPNNINATLHLRDIRLLWQDFYKTHPPESTSRADILKFATKVDRMLGYSFVPPIG